MALDKSDLYHYAPSFADVSEANVSQFVGGDFGTYKFVQAPGSVNGVTWVFEYIMNSSNEVMHQLFYTGSK